MDAGLPQAKKRKMQRKSSRKSQAYERDVTYWQECIRHWYPELHKRTYFLPPLYFNRVPYEKGDVGGHSVLVLKEPYCSVSPSSQNVPNSEQVTPQSRRNTPARVFDSMMRDDRAQQRVLHCLRVLADNSQPREVMMVVSQLQFEQYLDKPSYAKAAAFFPRPLNLTELFKHRPRGDFDVLIIHDKHGLITCEVKSVGENFSTLHCSDCEKDDILAKTVIKATGQLNKAETVLKYMVSDIPGVHVAKALVMPNVDSSRLQRALKSNSAAAEALCNCLQVEDLTKAVELCLCADPLPDAVTPNEIPEKTFAELYSWWRSVLSCIPKSNLTPETYENIVARFCGPATTVRIHCITPPRLEMRTEGEAVSEAGDRIARIVLVPEQIELLNASPPRVFIVGPPGTGKTVCLILQGLVWLKRGHDVHILSTWSKSLVASILIERQLSKTLKALVKEESELVGSNSPVDESASTWNETVKEPNDPQIHRHNFDFRYKVDDVTTSADVLSKACKRNVLCILADEAGPDVYSTRFTEFCEKLMTSVAEPVSVCLWAAAVQRHFRPPESLMEVSMSTPLRSPQFVVKEIEKAVEIQKYHFVQDYTATKLPETFGPHVRHIRHRSGQLEHSGEWPEDCEQCGREVAGILKELQVGPSAENRPGTGRAGLQYRDVLVLCGEPRDKGEGTTGEECGLVRGLRACGIPVRVVGRFACDDTICSLAFADCDEVTVTYWDNVRGLERKVVVAPVYGDRNRLHGPSRCTSQLVLIE